MALRRQRVSFSTKDWVGIIQPFNEVGGLFFDDEIRRVAKGGLNRQPLRKLMGWGWMD